MQPRPSPIYQTVNTENMNIDENGSPVTDPDQHSQVQKYLGGGRPNVKMFEAQNVQIIG